MHSDFSLKMVARVSGSVALGSITYDDFTEGLIGSVLWSMNHDRRKSTPFHEEFLSLQPVFTPKCFDPPPP